MSLPLSNPWFAISMALMWLVVIVLVAIELDAWRWRRKERRRRARRPGYVHAVPPPDDSHLDTAESIFEERRRRW